jgi:hypothetical protein
VFFGMFNFFGFLYVWGQRLGSESLKQKPTEFWVWFGENFDSFNFLAALTFCLLSIFKSNSIFLTFIDYLGSCQGSLKMLEMLSYIGKFMVDLK